MKKESCLTCRFWAKGTSEAFPDVNGQCRRYAPQGPVIGSHNNGWQIFPPMNSDAWCGEYESEQVNILKHRVIEQKAA